MTTAPTKGEREAELARAVIRAHQEAFGRGPGETRAFLLEGVAVVYLVGVLTPPEARLARSKEPEDQALVRQLRQRLTRQDKQALRAAAEAALGVAVRTVLTDVSPETDEAAYVFALAGVPPSRPRRADAGAADVEKGKPEKDRKIQEIL
jgi:uncharacterized protein YbcI